LLVLVEAAQPSANTNLNKRHQQTTPASTNNQQPSTNNQQPKTAPTNQ